MVPSLVQCIKCNEGPWDWTRLGSLRCHGGVREEAVWSGLGVTEEICSQLQVSNSNMAQFMDMACSCVREAVLGNSRALRAARAAGC